MLFERGARCLLLLAVFNLLNTCVHVDAQYGNHGVDEMSHLTPTPPAAENVDCYVSVRRVEQVAGRCITLGGPSGTFGCQASAHLEVESEDCRKILRHRTRFRSGSRRRHMQRPRSLQ